MHAKKLHWMIGIATALVLSSCAATENKSPAEGQAYAGWYMQHGGQLTFQPCGQSQRIHVSAAADLAARARTFGLQQDSPIYVRLMGAMQGDAIDVSRVEQFGSPIPVRDCAMTGVVISAPTPAGH